MRLLIIAALAFTSLPVSSPAEAQQRVNPASVCVNGFRITHVVRSHGRDYGGVILRFDVNLRDGSDNP